MKWGDAEKWLQEQLSIRFGSGEAVAMADLVMEHITGENKTGRSAKTDDVLNVQQLHHLTEVNQRLSQHEPVQYILKEAWFYGLKLFVDGSVLIPRTETEELVEWILKDVKSAGISVFEKTYTEADRTRTLKILDAGCGSGCIALALKNNMPLAEVWGCDISEKALNVSRRNGSELNIRVDFQGVNFLDTDAQKGLPTVDILVSNPPYIPRSGSLDMKKNVVDHEPHLALFIPDNDPLLFYRALAGFGHHRLHPGGSIYCEIHEDQGAGVCKLFESEGYKNVELRKDMQGRDRMVRIRL